MNSFEYRRGPTAKRLPLCSSTSQEQLVYRVYCSYAIYGREKLCVFPLEMMDSIRVQRMTHVPKVMFIGAMSRPDRACNSDG